MTLDSTAQFERPAVLRRNGNERFVLPKGREPFVPTPLDPYSVYRDDGTPYFIGSLDKIHSLVDDIEGQHPVWMTECVRESLMAALSRRCSQNHDAHTRLAHNLSGMQLEEDFLQSYERARAGTASITELLAITGHEHGPRAVELAKISHPLDWHATKAMDEAVLEKIDEYDRTAVYPQPLASHRYKYQNSIRDKSGYLRAIVVNRKRDVAQTRDGLAVVKRSSLIIRLDEQLDAGQQAPGGLRQYLDEALREAHDTATTQPTGKREAVLLAAMNNSIAGVAPETIEAVLAAQPGERPAWLVPTATSYYCKALDREPLAYKHAVPTDIEAASEAAKPADKAARELLGSAAAGQLVTSNR